MERIDITSFDDSQILNVGTVNTYINNLRNVQEQLKDKLNGVSLFFRGHANKDWTLTPGIYRNNVMLKKEHTLVHDIIRHCPIEFQSCHSSFEKLVKMQHYELPTRLLDISMNPLVGLYFAVNEEYSYDGELHIFLIKDSDLYNFDDGWVNILSRFSFLSTTITNIGTSKDTWSNLMRNLRTFQEPYPFLTDFTEFNKVVCVLPKLDNPRIIRQQGAFFLFGMKDGIKEQIADLEVSSIKFKVPACKKKGIISQLDQLGINEKFCFPEIDNVAHYLKEQCSI